MNAKALAAKFARRADGSAASLVAEFGRRAPAPAVVSAGACLIEWGRFILALSY